MAELLASFWVLLSRFASVPVSERVLVEHIGHDLFMALFNARALRTAEVHPRALRADRCCDNELVRPRPGPFVVLRAAGIAELLGTLLHTERDPSLATGALLPRSERIGYVPWAGGHREAFLMVDPPDEDVARSVDERPCLWGRPLLIVPARLPTAPPVPATLAGNVAYLEDMVEVDLDGFALTARSRWTGRPMTAAEHNARSVLLAPSYCTQHHDRNTVGSFDRGVPEAPYCLLRDHLALRTIPFSHYRRLCAAPQAFHLFVNAVKPVLPKENEREARYFCAYRDWHDVYRPGELLETRLQVLLPILANGLVGAPTGPDLSLAASVRAWVKLAEDARGQVDGTDDDAPGVWRMLHRLTDDRFFFDPSDGVKYAILRPLEAQATPTSPSLRGAIPMFQAKHH